jgi:hypothetical protein
VTISGRTENYSANMGFHYVVGVPTATMPTTGTATYSMIGATQPTYTDGRATPGIFSGSLGVDFASRAVNGTFNVAMTDGKGYGWTGSTSISGYSFFMSSSSFEVTGSGGACGGSGCTAFVHGLFAGAAAERAGIGYRIDDNFSTQVIGAAALKKD